MNRILTIAIAAVAITPLLFAAEQKTTKAPDFTLANYDGKTVKLSDYAGKIVVLEWFNYECPFARYNYEKTTAVNDLVNRFKDKGVVFLAINSTGHQESTKNKEFAEQFKVSHPILNDSSGKVGKAYGAKTTPHTFIIDAKGNIAYSGAFDNAPLGKIPEGAQYVNYIDKALGELTGGKAVSIAETKPYGCSVKYGK
ncbi:MAG: redoxin domain-containing protein [Sedimentisphaerales bacterium]|jgi:peroxiredoxin